jgi:hypothetical protein
MFCLQSHSIMKHDKRRLGACVPLPAAARPDIEGWCTGTSAAERFLFGVASRGGAHR